MRPKILTSVITVLAMACCALAAGPLQNPTAQNSALEDCLQFNTEQLERLLQSRGGSAAELPAGYLRQLLRQGRSGVGAPTATQTAVALVQSETTYAWIDDHWDPMTKSTRSYSGNKLVTLLVENWESGNWANASFTSMTYDAEDSVISTTYQLWFEDAWLNNYRTTNSYDPGGKLTGTLTEVWQADTWIESSRAIMTYIGDLISEWRYQVKLGDEWMDQTRVTYQYNAGNEYTSYLSQSWNGIAWVNSSLWTYSYNDNNQLAELLFQTWQSNAWTNFRRNSYDYDVTNARVLDVSYRWLANAWQATEADTFRYNGWHQLTEQVTWEISSGNKYRYTYEFDPAWNVTAYNSFTWDAIAGWVNDLRFVYVYDTELAVELDDKPLPRGYDLDQNFPNPFNPRTAIRYSLARAGDVLITVHNVLGQRVRVLENGQQSAGFYETGWNGTNDSGQTVASGIYFYRIRSGDFTSTRKMVLLR